MKRPACHRYFDYHILVIFMMHRILTTCVVFSFYSVDHQHYLYKLGRNSKDTNLVLASTSESNFGDFNIPDSTLAAYENGSRPASYDLAILQISTIILHIVTLMAYCPVAQWKCCLRCERNKTDSKVETRLVVSNTRKLKTCLCKGYIRIYICCIEKLQRHAKNNHFSF